MSEVAVAPEAVTETATPAPEQPELQPQDAVEVTLESAPETTESEVTAPVEEAPPPPPPRTPDSYSHQELNQLYLEGKLNDPALVTRREQFNRDEYSRQQREAQALQQRRQRDQQNLQRIQQLEATTVAGVIQGAEAEIQAALRVGREPDIGLITERAKAQIKALAEQSRDIHMAPKEAALRDILSVAYPGVQGADYLARLDFDDLVVEMWKTGLEQGKATGLGPDSVVKTKAEYEKELKAAEEAGYNKWRSENTVGAPPNGVVRSNGARLSPSEADTAFNEGTITREQWHEYTAPRRRET